MPSLIDVQDDSLSQHVRDCAALHEDFRGLIHDWQLKASGFEVCYAVDFAEIYSYVLPESNRSDLAIFRDDSPSVTVAVQHYVISKLFFGLDSKLVLLPPYALELRSFADFLRSGSTTNAIKVFAEVQREAHEITAHTEFGRVEALVARMSDTNGEEDTADLRAALEFFEQHAANLLRLVDRSDPKPINRLSQLLQMDRLVPLSALTAAALNLDEDLVDEWEARLEQARRKRSASNRLDALAAVLVMTSNDYFHQEGSQVRIRLVSRSRHMHAIERDLRRAAGTRAPAELFMRHPRALLALRRTEGQAAATTVDRLNVMQTTLELVIGAYQRMRRAQDQSGGTRERPSSDQRESRETIGRLLDQIRDELHGGANLASLAAVTHSDLIQSGGGSPDRTRILHLFGMLQHRDRLLGYVQEEITELANSLDRNQQLLALALQRQGITARRGPLQYEADGTTTIAKSKLYWMPYTLEFENPDLRDWAAQFKTKADTSLGELLEYFREGFALNLEYDMSLSLAYVLGAWDRWDLALKYCDIALVEQRLRQRSAAHEGKFFKALCLRMLFAETGEHYDEALALLEEALQIKGLENPQPDARYVNEKATLLFYWSRAIRRRNRPDSARDDWRADTAIQLSHTALELAADDRQLRAQIFNNLCFYYADDHPERHQAEIRTNLRSLESELQSTPVEQWPINFVDTALVARCRLQNEALDLHRWLRLKRLLRQGLDSESVRSSDVRDVVRHLAEASDVLPAGVDDDG